MNRRELLKMIALATGSTVIGGELFLTGCASNNTAAIKEFSKEDIAFLDEVAETILPKTKTPGAKDAAVGKFMTIMVNDCYTPKDQKVFHEGIKQLDKASKELYKMDFIRITPAQRHDLLLSIEKEAKGYQVKKLAFNKVRNEKQKEQIKKGNPDFIKEEMAAHYYTMMKQLTLLGFFTSKPGANEALRFVAVPGRYDSCIPYKKGDRAWV